MESFNYHNIKFEDLYYAPINIVGYKDDGLHNCCNCGQTLYLNDYYIESDEDLEDFINAVIEKLAEIISKKIHYCSHCSDGQDIERYLYILEKEDEIAPDYGTEIWEFLSEQGIYDYGIKEKILNYLYCSGCKFGTGRYDDVYEQFDPLDKVYTQQDIDDFYGLNYEDFADFAKSYELNISREEIQEFVEFLYDKPYLALLHKVGKEIYRVIEQHYKNKNYLVLEVGEKLYRGRTRKKDHSPFEPKDLWNPPKGSTSHGRYNAIGVSVLYCTDSINAIPYEIHPSHDENIDVATFMVEKPLFLFDVSSIFNEKFGDLISSTVLESKEQKKGYLLTNFIRDCCYDVGYHGIKYKGVGKGEYYNFALFNFEKGVELSISDNVVTISPDVSYNISKIPNAELELE